MNQPSDEQCSLRARSRTRTFSSVPHKLTTEERESLLSCLCIDAIEEEIDRVASAAIAEVEHILGVYEPLALALANGCRATKGLRETRGRKKEEARARIVGELRRVFRKHYQESEFVRSGKGAAKALSQAESDEAEFISTALNSVGVAYPVSRRRSIRRIYDIPGTPLADRSRAVASIVEKYEARISRLIAPG